MINFDEVMKEETKEHNPNCPDIPDHLYQEKQIHYLI